MDFLSLPVEIGSKIYDYLDTKAQINVYNSCDEFRNYFTSWSRPIKAVLSRSTLATVKSLEEKFFVEFGKNIVELNLSGIQDLTVDALSPHIKRFVNLKSLDVTFTSIYLSDISAICPQSLRSIGINFCKSFSNYKFDRINDESKEVFKERQFKFIHFVIMELCLSASPLKFLEDVNFVPDLKLTISDNYKDVLNFGNEDNENESPIVINFSKLTLVARDCAVTHRLSKELDGIAKLNFKHLEYIFIMSLEKIEIYVSPLLARLFTISCSDLRIEVCSYLPLNLMLDGNIVFKAWNKKTTSFDEGFYKSLLIELTNYFPTYFCMHKDQIMKIIDSPNTWYCIDKCEKFKELIDLPDKITLSDFCRHDGVVRKCWRPISLSKSSKALQHLTFLRMNDIPIRDVFFTILFEQCPKLITLDVYMESTVTIQSYTQSLLMSIHLAKLRNFMLISEDINFEVIFAILSRCPSLENVHICEHERQYNDEAINETNTKRCIENCVNLYSLFIEADLSEEGLTMLMAPLRTTAQALNRDYLSIEVCQCNWGWNPFADVFSPSPLHIFQ